LTKSLVLETNANSEVAAFMAIQASSPNVKIFRGIITRLRDSQEVIAEHCRDIINKIEALDIPEPGVLQNKKSKTDDWRSWLCGPFGGRG
jgi:hypothetical protein